MTKRWLAILFVALFAVVPAHAGAASGPKEGDKVEPLKVYAVSGDPQEKEVEYTSLRQDRPTVYVFVAAKEFDRPMFRFMKKLEEKLGDDGLLVAVWVTDDAEQSKQYLPRITKYFEKSALTVFGEAGGPKGWSLNADARLTAVVVHKGKVVRSFGYVSLNETNAPEVVKALKKAIKK
jgi:hypothetical protein